MGSSILFAYPEIGTIAGIQGAVVYAATSALPLLAFPLLVPILRKKSPDGFILTMWVQKRYGIIASLYLSALSLGTMFLYMVAELSALQQVIVALTGLDGLAVVIVEVIVTSVYTATGGFRISFLTDNIQGAVISLLIVICSIAIGTSVTIDRSKIGPSGLAKSSLLGYQLIYIFFIGILFSNLFLSNYWMRGFAARTDKDLWIGVSLAAVLVFVILMLVSSTGFIAAWSGLWSPGEYGGMVFFLLLAQLPAWVVGFVIVMVVALSCAVFDSLQSAMISTASNDLFRNKLPLIWIRILVALVTIPVIVIALHSPGILRIFMISNIFACAAIPAILLGLFDILYFLNGFDIICAGLGGVLSVWLFGLVFYGGNAAQAGSLIILVDGLYASDWSVFGVFVAAPVGSLIFLALAVGVRAGVMWVYCKATGKHFDVFKRKVPPPVLFDGGIREEHAQLPGSYLDDHVESPGSYLDEETAPKTT
ncbi:hypothetical protein RUND412_004975 [Rhizina undulata]